MLIGETIESVHGIMRFREAGFESETTVVDSAAKMVEALKEKSVDVAVVALSITS